MVYWAITSRQGGAAINKLVLGGLIGLILIIVLIVASFFIGPVLVDIFVILAALVSLVAFALLAYAAWVVVGLVKEIRGDVKTLINTAQDTMTEVRGTARFVSDTVVTPVSEAVGFVSAARATAKAFTEPLYSKFRG